MPERGRVRPREVPVLAQTPNLPVGLHPEHRSGSSKPRTRRMPTTIPCGDVHGAVGITPGWLWAQLPAGPIPAPRCPKALAGAQRYGAAPAQLLLSVTLPMTVPHWQANSTLHMDLHRVPAAREKGWYLALMAPNTKGPHYAWLDPSRLYCHPQGLKDCVTDLLQPFQGDPIDLVAGIDAMGFILGAAVAATLHKGFLAIRKAGHLCVETLAEPYTDYSGREKVMEVRTDTVTPGMRILLVDQWVETGGTMRAAIQLVERQGGVVAGVAAICIEDSEGGRWIREHYKCAHCVPPRLQPRFDQHQMGWE